jgi:MoxR-like ATPase
VTSAQSGCTLALREEFFVTTDDLVRQATVNTLLDDAVELASSLQQNLNAVVLGTPGAVVAATTAVLAAGHLLIEDVPGVGKTMLAKAVAVSIGTRLARIQGHPDLLPSDITGVSIFSATSDTWDFRPGPVFAHVVLFDELNRTPPRSQAALLEAMEERQVTVDGESWPLPEPHLVLATQNPVDQAGTFPLVESQMDRFLLATRVGYPDEATEATLALSHGAQPSLSALSPVCTPAGLASAQSAVAGLAVAPAVARYGVAVVRATRSDPLIRLGASPRATIGLLAAARAHAVICGRDFVIPDDVKAVASNVLAHRLVTDASPVGAFDAGISLIEAILERVPSPRP